MKESRTSFLLAAAACLMAVATSAAAQDASTTRHTKYVHTKYYAEAPVAQAATTEVSDAPCRLEDYDTGVHWHSLRTMCGPR